jgi:hypothetical protein
MNFINGTISPSAAVTSFTTALTLQIHSFVIGTRQRSISVKKQFCLLNYQVHRRQQYGALILSDAVFPHQVLPSIGLLGSTRQDCKHDEFPHPDQ